MFGFVWFCEAVSGHWIMLLFIVVLNVYFCEAVTLICYEKHAFLNTSAFHENMVLETWIRELDFESWSIILDCNPCHFSIISLLHFVKFLKEQMNMMLLQESGNLNKTLEVEQQ